MTVRMFIVGIAACWGCAEICEDCDVPPPPPGPPTFNVCPAGQIGEGETCHGVGPRCDLPIGQRGELDCPTVGASCPSDQRITPSGCAPLGWTECPAGFVGGPGACRPVLPPTPCREATMALLGSTECIELPGCGDPFPPPGASYFVDPAGPIDAAHFRSIQAALDAAPAGATIAVERGVYREVLLVDHPVTLIGRCAREVEVRGPGVLLPGLWIRSTRGVDVRGLSLVGHDGGVELDGRSELALDGMRIEDNVGVGLLLLQTSSVTVQRSVIRGGRSRPDGSSGRGIALQAGSELTAIDVAVEANRDIGLYVSGRGTKARGRRMIIAGTLPSAGDDGGQGVYVKAEGALDLSASAILRSARAGIVIADLGAEVALAGVALEGVELGFGVDLKPGAVLRADGLAIRDVVGLGLYATTSSATIMNALVTGTRTPPSSDQAFGVAAAEGARLRLEGVELSDNDFLGLSLEGQSTRVTLVGSTIRGTRGDLAPAINLLGGDLTIEEANIEDNGAAGILFSTEGGIGTFDHLSVRGTRPHDGAQTGGGIIVNTGTVSISNSDLADNYSLGLGVGRDDSSANVILRHTTVRGSRGRPDVPIDREEGYGVWVARTSRFEARDSTFEDNEFAGIFVQGTAEIFDSKIARSHPNTRGDYGNGLYAEGRLRLERSLVADCRTIGLQAHGLRAEVTAIDTLIEGTLAKLAQIFGHGAAASLGGTLIFEGSEVRKSAGAGIVLQAGAVVVTRTNLTLNAVGIFAADGLEIDEIEGPAAPVQGRLLITSDSIFEGNQSRTGLGPVPLPDPLVGPR